jgi:hypothetical protein
VAASGPAEAGPAAEAGHTLLRQRLCGAFANGVLFSDAALPCLCASKHFVNLTNGLELVPVLQELQQPFRCVGQAW